MFELICTDCMGIWVKILRFRCPGGRCVRWHGSKSPCLAISSGSSSGWRKGQAAFLGVCPWDISRAVGKNKNLTALKRGSTAYGQQALRSVRCRTPRTRSVRVPAPHGRSGNGVLPRSSTEEKAGGWTTEDCGDAKTVENNRY